MKPIPNKVARAVQKKIVGSELSVVITVNHGKGDIAVFSTNEDADKAALTYSGLLSLLIQESRANTPVGEVLRFFNEWAVANEQIQKKV